MSEEEILAGALDDIIASITSSDNLIKALREFII